MPLLSRGTRSHASTASVCSHTCTFLSCLLKSLTSVAFLVYSSFPSSSLRVNSFSLRTQVDNTPRGREAHRGLSHPSLLIFYSHTPWTSYLTVKLLHNNHTRWPLPPSSPPLPSLSSPLPHALQLWAETMQLSVQGSLVHLHLLKGKAESLMGLGVHSLCAMHCGTVVWLCTDQLGNIGLRSSQFLVLR